MWVVVILVVYILVAIVLMVSILLNGARPAKTLGWLLAIFTIPVGGILLYLLLGRNRRKQKFHDLKQPKPQFFSFDGHNENLFSENIKIIELAKNIANSQITVHNAVLPLKDGQVTFEHIFKALNGAKHHIHIQYYIFEEGALADRLLELFKHKTKQGVKVRLIYDSIGSYSLSGKYLEKLKSAGVETYAFFPIRFGRLFSSINYRNHRKIIVVDDEIGFTGGINISDKYLKGDPELGRWHDMHLQIQGEAAHHLNRVFAMDWYLASRQKINLALERKPKKSVSPLPVQIVPSGPDDDFSTIEQVYFAIINGAKEYIYITNPYIIPSRAILLALQTASLTGLDVRLMVSKKADSKLVGWCVRSYFEAFLKAGIKIYLYPDGFLHSKIMVSDDHMVSIGTANFDNRSFQQNYEVNALIYDKDFASLLKHNFIEDYHKCRILDHEEYIKRPWVHRLFEGMARIFSPLL